MKRIALIADLHGNLPAVEALEQDLKTRSVDEIWCLGDIVGKGPSSPDTFDWAMAHCSLILRGNWDEGVASRTFSRNDQFYYSQLGEKRWIRFGSFLLCISIILATMFIKQHSVFDVATAFVMAGALYAAVYRFDCLGWLRSLRITQRVYHPLRRRTHKAG